MAREVFKIVSNIASTLIENHIALKSSHYSLRNVKSAVYTTSSDLLKLYDEKYNKDPFSESTIQLGDTLLDEISD